jgi:hypothetical protein
MPTIVDAMCSNCRTAFEKGRKQSVIGVYKEILGKSDFFRNKMPDGRSHCELRAFIRTRIKELEK